MFYICTGLKTAPLGKSRNQRGGVDNEHNEDSNISNVLHRATVFFVVFKSTCAVCLSVFCCAYENTVRSFSDLFSFARWIVGLGRSIWFRFDK